LLIVIIVALFLLVAYPSVSWKIQTLLSRSENPTPDEYKKLILENESLKAAAMQLQEIKKQTPSNSDSLLSVFVYSRYPFNFKNELLINAGLNQDMTVGQAAVITSSSTLSNPVLVGKIQQVFENVSVVQTIFDSRFQLAVRIGKSGVNALLKGGNEPRLTLIPKDAKTSEGDIAYSASPDFPYGLPVGIIRRLRLSTDQLFQEADIGTAYNPNELDSVSIIKDRYNR